MTLLPALISVVIGARLALLRPFTYGDRLALFIAWLSQGVIGACLLSLPCLFIAAISALLH